MIEVFQGNFYLVALGIIGETDERQPVGLCLFAQSEGTNLDLGTLSGQRF